MGLIRRWVLSNGIRVAMEQIEGVRSVSIGVWVKRGSLHEQPHQRGISHFIEHLLFKGTKRRTALDIARHIESVGGVLNAFTSREYTCFYAKVLSKDVPLAIDILSDILINSTFKGKELEKERLVVLQEISMVEDTPDDLVHDLFMERLWQGHPAGWAVLGTPQTVGSISRKEVLEYFRQNYTPENVVITLAGDIEPENVLKLVEKAFAKMRRKGARRRTSRPKSKGGLYVLRRKLEQVHLCIGLPALPLTDRARYTMHVMNTLFGGGMSSRLFQEVRERRGLAYSIYSYLNLMRMAGSFVVYAGTSREELGELIKVVLDEYERLKDGVEAEELKVAAEQLKGGILLGLESTENRMTKLARDEIYFNRTVPVDHIVEAIDAVSPEGLKELACRLIDRDRLVLVAIGDVDEDRVYSYLN